MHDFDLSSARAARALACAAIVTLCAMIVTSLATGVTQEQFETVRVGYREAIIVAAKPLRTVIALDTVFLIVYSAFFVMLVRALGVSGSGVVRLGVGALLATAVLDMIEDHHLLALTQAALDGAAIDDATVRFQHVLSQVKFHISYLGLAFVALGLPRRTARERGFAWALGVPLPILGAIIWGTPASAATLDVARWVGFLAGFAGAIVVLRR